MIKEKMKQLIGKSINKYNTQHVKDVVSELKFKEQYQGRIIDCMVGEVDDNYIETPETDSSIVKLEHSKEGLIKVPSIKGKTILVDTDGNETDTPGEGCRLISVGESEDNRLLISSKNKNINSKVYWGNIRNGVFNSDTISICSEYIRAYEGINYTSSISDGYEVFYYVLYDLNKNYIETIPPTSRSFTAPYDCYFRCWRTKHNTNNWLQVEIGNQTLYVEPKHHKTEILLNEPLRSLPNGVCDEILGNQLIRRVGKVVLDGKNVTSIGIINDNVVDVLYFDKTVTNKKFINYGSEGQQLIKSNIYRTGINANNWNSTTSENTLVNTSSSGFWIFLPKFTVLNIEDARNYMNNKPTEVLYELAEPIIEELPNSITIQGFDDTTMYIENSITPTVTYGYNALIPYKEEVLNQQQEVETNTLDIEQNIIPYLMDMEFNLMLMEDE